MLMPEASLNQGFLLHPCSNTAAPAFLFYLMCCQMELHFARPADWCCWFGPFMCLCQCWQVNQPRRLVLQAPSYTVSPLELQRAYANIMHRPWGYMGVGQWFLAYPVFILCLWGVRSLPPYSEYDPPQPTKLYSCATTAPLLLPTRRASPQLPACIYKVIQIHSLQSYTKPTN